ncbi:hypothetical protein F5Y08DRAFT_165007 [Xylaria arbuscula]|nr:hypothetical protein F5Y08DRAFT_165007 [Xylaria arbuscula]
MDAQQPQSPPLASKSQVDPDVVMDGQHPQDGLPGPSAVPENPKLDPGVEASEEKTPTVTEGDAKGADVFDSEVETPTEASKPQPPSPGPSTPTKKQKQRPTSTRASDEIFKTPPNRKRENCNHDDDETGDEGKGKGKKRNSHASNAGDSTTSSSSSADSNEEKRLSDKVKKAWREVRGQSGCRDPLEQWMVKHSGGTFKEKPRRQVFGDSPEK